jgi:hypothetical protein
MSSKGRTPATTVQVTDVPEVQAFLTAEEELREHIKSNQAFYDQLCALAEKRNTVLQEADKIVRAKNVSCGPFQKKSETTYINVELLFDELGLDGFKAVGGYTEEVTTYKVDRDRFLAYLAAGHVPKEVAAVATENRPSYVKIDPYNLP